MTDSKTLRAEVARVKAVREAFAGERRTVDKGEP
jgi:hypothetical protein